MAHPIESVLTTLSDLKVILLLQAVLNVIFSFNCVEVDMILTDITTVALYVAGCDLKKSLIFEKIFEINSYMHFPVHVQTYGR